MRLHTRAPLRIASGVMKMKNRPGVEYPVIRIRLSRELAMMANFVPGDRVQVSLDPDSRAVLLSHVDQDEQGERENPCGTVHLCDKRRVSSGVRILAMWPDERPEMLGGCEAWPGDIELIDGDNGGQHAIFARYMPIADRRAQEWVDPLTKRPASHAPAPASVMLAPGALRLHPDYQAPRERMRRPGFWRRLLSILFIRPAGY